MIIPFECPSCGKAVEAERNPDANTASCPECGQEGAVPLGIFPGVTLGNGYRIEEQLEETSVGETYKAYQVAMQRHVMVKTLSPSMVYDEESLGRFLREVKLTGSLRHPHILGAIDAGADSGIYFLVTEYKPGVTLQQSLQQRGGALPEKEVLGLLIPIAEALQHAWREKKILHRNVKPENILITESQQPMLMNLGIAKSMEEDSMNLTGADYTVGTPEYMSPEQVQGEDDIDFRADLYSMGIVLYRAVVGEVPFSDPNPVMLMTKQLEEDPEPACERNPDVSGRCSSLIDKMLRKDKEERYKSWQELIDAMRAIAAGKTATALPAAGKQKKVAVGKKAGAAVAGARAKGSSGRGKVGAKAGGGAVGGGRITRKDVEQIASALSKGPSVGTKLVLYMLSAIVPIALIAVAVLMSQDKKPAPRPPKPVALMQPAATPTPTVAPVVKPPAPSSTSTAARKEEEMFRYAKAYYQQNPTDFDGAVARFAEVKKQTVGTKFSLMANDMIQQIQADKTAALTTVVSELDRKAQQFVGANMVAEAIAVYQDYQGPLANETTQTRQARIAELRQKHSQQEERKREQASQAGKQLGATCQQIVAALLAKKPAVAAKLAGEAAAKPEFASGKRDLTALRDFSEAYAQKDELVLKALEGMVNKTVKLRLLRHGSSELLIKRVQKGQVLSDRILKKEAGKASVAMALKFTPKDLHPQEKVNCLKKLDPDYCSALCGMIALEAGKNDVAAKYFARDQTVVGRLLAEQFSK